MPHFAVIVGFLHPISWEVVNQPLSIGVIKTGRWSLLILKSIQKAKYIEWLLHNNYVERNVCKKWVVQFHSK